MVVLGLVKHRIQELLAAIQEGQCGGILRGCQNDIRSCLGLYTSLLAYAAGTLHYIDFVLMFMGLSSLLRIGTLYVGMMALRTAPKDSSNTIQQRPEPPLKTGTLWGCLGRKTRAMQPRFERTGSQLCS